MTVPNTSQQLQKRLKQSIIFLMLNISVITNTLIANNDINAIINDIGALEKDRDPKCYATASRLEDFMFGTPLSQKARFKKNRLQRSWLTQLWKNASSSATSRNLLAVSPSQVLEHFNAIVDITTDPKGHATLSFTSGKIIRINKTDKRQYSSIAYSLRTLLAVQQQSLLEENLNLLPLQADAQKLMTSYLDYLSLAALKIADNSARRNNQFSIDEVLYTDIWLNITSLPQDTKNLAIKENKNVSNKIPSKQTSNLTLVNQIIDQKIASYRAYNQVSNKIFYRNLQSFYARVRLSDSNDEQKKFRKIFNESMIQFSFDLYKESERIALNKNHSTIHEEDVHELLQIFLPHRVDSFEDTHFFPALKAKNQILIESYDADSFRDNSAHWRFLKLALKSNNLNSSLQPDPFALELITENIALFGVLSLRMAGLEAKKSESKILNKKHFESGLKEISKRIALHRKMGINDTKENKKDTEQISSSENKIVGNHKTDNEAASPFSDISSALGLELSNRSSDWLNRLLRSYLEKKKGVGVLYIPPAFGGNGIAAEDLNSDGFVDLLILSGSGNRLYMNNAGENFVDMTALSGINWVREIDNLPGEPRQPLIADFNNDGLQDIVITYVKDKHRVYRNLGNFKFEDVTNKSNLGGTNLVGGPATVADFNNDGKLDLYITYFGDYTKGILPTLARKNDNATPNQLFQNTGDFTFKNVTKGSGVDNKGWAQAVSHTDLDSDGWQDIIVGNDFGINAYYRNNQDGTFTDISFQLGTNKPSYSMSVGIADLNQDLHPDIYVSNIVVMNKDEKYVAPNKNTEMKFNPEKLSHMKVIEANDLFLSNKITPNPLSYQLSKLVARGYSSTGWSWDADFFDYDNDGDMDLYVLNGMNEFNIYTSDNPYFTDSNNKKQQVYIPVAEKERNVFLINHDGKLNNPKSPVGTELLGNSRSAAYLDFDQDGDLDIALNNYHEKAVFFQNNLEKDRSKWIKIKLVGDANKDVNRDAIGARIIIHTKSGKTLWREIHGSTGYMSVHPKIQHFGLGEYAIDFIKIIWPNGEVQRLPALTINQAHLIYQSKIPKKNSLAL